MAIKIKNKDISFSKQLVLLTLTKLGYTPNNLGFLKIKELTGIDRITVSNVINERSREFTFDKVLKILAIFGVSGQDIIKLVENSIEINEKKEIKLLDDSSQKAIVKNPWS